MALDSLRLADADVQDSPDSRSAAEAPPTRVRVHNLGRISSRSELGAVASEHGRRGSYDATGTYIEPKEGDDGDRDLPDESESEKRDESCESAAKQSPATGTPTMSDAVKNGGRLLIVANRLPLSMTIKKKIEEGTDKEVQTVRDTTQWHAAVEHGKRRSFTVDSYRLCIVQITFSNSSGGLVSALSGCDMESRWIGWPGAEVRREADRQMVTKKLEALKCKPVFLTQRVCDPLSEHTGQHGSQVAAAQAPQICFSLLLPLSVQLQRFLQQFAVASVPLHSSARRSHHQRRRSIRSIQGR